MASHAKTAQYKVGDLVYITPAGHFWITRSQRAASFNGVSLAGRTAMILDVYDWNTQRGKEILAGRLKNGKWLNMNSQDFKYVLMVFYPELELEGQQGIMHPELLPLKHPHTDGNPPLFVKYPAAMLDYVSGKKKFVPKAGEQ